MIKCDDIKISFTGMYCKHNNYSIKSLEDLHIKSTNPISFNKKCPIKGHRKKDKKFETITAITMKLQFQTLELHGSGTSLNKSGDPNQ